LVAKWLNQAGVRATYVKLEMYGLPAMAPDDVEKNSAGISKFFMSWLIRTFTEATTNI